MVFLIMCKPCSLQRNHLSMPWDTATATATGHLGFRLVTIIHHSSDVAVRSLYIIYYTSSATIDSKCIYIYINVMIHAATGMEECPAGGRVLYPNIFMQRQGARRVNHHIISSCIQSTSRVGPFAQQRQGNEQIWSKNNSSLHVFSFMALGW